MELKNVITYKTVGNVNITRYGLIYGILEYRSNVVDFFFLAGRNSLGQKLFGAIEVEDVSVESQDFLAKFDKIVA